MDPGLLFGEVAGGAAALEGLRRWVAAPLWRGWKSARAKYDEIHDATSAMTALQPQVIGLIEQTNALGHDMRQLSGSVVNAVLGYDKRIDQLAARVIDDGPKRIRDIEATLARLVDEFAELHSDQRELAERTSELERWLAQRRRTDREHQTRRPG